MKKIYKIKSENAMRMEQEYKKRRFRDTWTVGIAWNVFHFVQPCDKNNFEFSVTE